jgi:DNA-binding IclR family transcriptional regulator
MTLQSVENALTILELLRDRDDAGVSELAGLVGVAPSTAHRLLSTLLVRGFVRQTDNSKKYKLTSAMTGVREGKPDADYVTITHDLLVRLEEATHETVHLAMLDGTNSRYLDVVESRQQLHVPSRVGVPVPAHASSAGKALLATFPPLAVSQLYPEDELPRSTRMTVCSKAELDRDLANVRIKGYARIIEEWEPEVSALAMPVVGPNRICSLAITVSGPQKRLGFSKGTSGGPAEQMIVHYLRAATNSLRARLNS